MTSQKNLTLRGLKSAVSIRIDQSGIAHISATCADDLFFAQGWNAARDRLWQIDTARKRGLGLLAADLGPGYREQDRAARLFLYRGDMAAEWAAYAPDAEAICTAFAAGINAYVDGVLAGDLPLPPEFEQLGTQPAHWQAADVVRVRSHSLTRNATSELLRARVMALAGAAKGAELDELRRSLEPKVAVEVPEGVELSEFSARVIRDFLLAVSPVSFTPERLAAKPEEAALWVAPTPLGDIDRTASTEGSNNWAISAGKSATGRPILCLDPHRNHVLPSIRYLVHLTMPGFDAIGAGEAFVPGISMGHNGTSAFALTIFGDDQEDLYVYDTHPDDPDLYRYNDGWEAMEKVEEVIEVKGADPHTAVLRFTRHGPVLYQKGNRAYAMRSVWTGPGAAPYMASLSVMRAKNRDSYLDALSTWGCPSVNHIYADTAGEIVWKAVGHAPIRPNWTGLLPVAGDGRYEWQGLRPARECPVEINPERGFVATANAMNVPADWQGDPIAYEWADPSRHNFLNESFAALDKVSFADCARLQTSTQSRTSARLAACVQRMDLPAEMAALLSGYSGDAHANSGAAALLEIWLSRHLGPAIARYLQAPDAVLPLLAPYDTDSLTSWVEAHNPLPAPVRDSLDRAWADCVTLMGADATAWKWGDVHGMTLQHPLHRLDIPADWSCPRVGFGGAATSPNLASYRASDLEVISGPSVRMMIDVGAWDNSQFVNTPGQSGVPGNAHYRDLQSDWHGATYRPLPYSDAAIEALTETRIALNPA